MDVARANGIRLTPTPADLALIAAFLIGAFLAPLVFPRAVEGESVLVRAKGQELTLPLDRDQVVRVEGERGLTWIEVRDGRAHILRSACSNQRWHHGQGWASKTGQSLVCVPNRVLVEVQGGHPAQAGARVDMVVR